MTERHIDVFEARADELYELEIRGCAEGVFLDSTREENEKIRVREQAHLFFHIQVMPCNDGFYVIG